MSSRYLIKRAMGGMDALSNQDMSMYIICSLFYIVLCSDLYIGKDQPQLLKSRKITLVQVKTQPVRAENFGTSAHFQILFVCWLGVPRHSIHGEV